MLPSLTRHANKRTFSRAAKIFLDIILPPRCPMTGELVGENATISPTYWSQLNFIRSPLCPTCGAPYATPLQSDMVCGKCLQNPPVYHAARAVFRYDDPSSRMILKYKHADGTTMTPLFGRWMAQAGADLLADADLVIPVPLYRWRLLRRRYNQAALLSSWLAKHSGKQHAPLVLRRTRSTPSQGKRTNAERFDNVKNAFTVLPRDRDTIKGKTIVLIDDVYTSGATVTHCTETLLRHGAAKVSILTLARTGYAQ